MSVEAFPARTSLALSPRPAVARLVARRRLVLVAFAGSRLLTLVAGALGVLTVTPHDPAMAAATLRGLGPVGNVLAGSVDRFDATYYLGIAAHGYGPGAAGKIAFFPLYPLLIRLTTPLFASPVMAGVAISAGAFLGALTMLHRLTERELGVGAADACVLLLVFAPLSFFFTAVYTESLFLLLSVAACAAARGGRWRLACVLAAVATLARPTGLALDVGLGAMRIMRHRRIERGLAWALLGPATLLGYLGLLAAGGYPFLGVFTDQAQWHRITSGPVTAVGAAIWAALRGAVGLARGGAFYHPTIYGPFTAGAQSIVLFAVLALACAALVATVRRLPTAYGVLAAVELIVCLSSPEAGQPLWSFDRFTLTIFPLWMAAGAWLSERPRLRLPVLGLGAALLVFYTFEFSSWSFVA